MEGQKFPLCPYCEKEIKGIEWLHENIANIRIFICPHCSKILSIQEWYGPASSIPVEPMLPTKTEIM